jgi:deoxyribonuclease-4
MMLFGTAGKPLSCEGSSLEGVKCVKDLNLDAMELEFVHGCKMKTEKAEIIGKEASDLNIKLSAHASYYLNLISPRKEIVDKSLKELIVTGRVLTMAKAERLVLHSGFYLEMSRENAYKEMKKIFLNLIEEFEKEKLTAILAPELTGKATQFGSLEELYSLSEEIGYDKLRPTIDFAHYHSRENGKIKGKEDYVKLLEFVEKKVGKKGLQTLHCHMSSVNFTEKGERNHLTMDHNAPPFKPLAQALKEFNCSGTIISESPNIETDALYMKKTYESV